MKDTAVLAGLDIDFAMVERAVQSWKLDPSEMYMNVYTVADVTIREFYDGDTYKASHRKSTYRGDGDAKRRVCRRRGKLLGELLCG